MNDGHDVSSVGSQMAEILKPQHSSQRYVQRMPIKWLILFLFTGRSLIRNYRIKDYDFCGLYALFTEQDSVF